MKVEVIEKAAGILRDLKECRGELHYTKDHFIKFQKGGSTPYIEFLFGEDRVSVSQRISRAVATAAFEQHINNLEKKLEILEKELENI